MNKRMKKITSLLFLFFILNVLYPDETGTFGISLGDANLGYRIGIESGYIYNSFNRHEFYISIGTDLFVLSYAIGQSKIKDAEEHPEKYPDLRRRNENENY